MMLVLVIVLLVLVSVAFVRRRFICVSCCFFYYLRSVVVGWRRRNAAGIDGWLSVDFDLGEFPIGVRYLFENGCIELIEIDLLTAENRLDRNVCSTPL